MALPAIAPSDFVVVIGLIMFFFLCRSLSQITDGSRLCGADSQEDLEAANGEPVAFGGGQQLAGDLENLAGVLDFAAESDPPAYTPADGF